ncbi:hypothetical protein [Methanoregula sp.]|uniref:hypothetical protein n=1 Tax=Methanoregula sp. TaxID=2052170 RepID=UPI003BB09997
MKPGKINIIVVLASVLLVAGVLISGCTQGTGSGSGSAGNSQQVSPAGTGNSPSSGNGGSPGSSYAGNMGNGSRQYAGQRFLTNTTLLTAAAAQLGVSEQDLQNALTPQSGQRMNLTSAAAQLGVTPQQLQAALGFPAGGYHGNHTAAMATAGSGQ